MGNFCSGKQAKKEAKLEEKDKPGERGEGEAPGVGVTVGLDGVQVDVKEGDAAADEAARHSKADDGMREVKDRAKEIAKEAEAKLLARQQAAEAAASKRAEEEEEEKKSAESSAAATATAAAGALSGAISGSRWTAPRSRPRKPSRP